MAPYPVASWEDDLSFRSSMGDMSSTHWHRFLVSYQPSGTTDLADTAYVHFDIAKVTGQNIDPSWAQADFDAVNSALATFISAVSTMQTSQWTCTGHKAYRKGFNSYAAAGLPAYAHDDDPKTVWAPFADQGAPIRTVALNTVGLVTNLLPPQVACAVTNRNVKRRGWGRFYLPGITGTALDTTGGLSDATLTAIATPYQTFNTSLATSKLYVVTPTTTNQAAGQAKGETTPAFGLLQVSRIQVDSTLDVQRRRRHHVTRKVTSLP